MTRTVLKLSFILLGSLLMCGCISSSSVPEEPPSPTEDHGILGFGFLRRIPGLWHGPVTTTTPAGSFPDWYVDFRPISPSQAGQFSTLDQDTTNFISFFIVKHEGRLKVAMRTEGVFQNKGCVTYEVLDRADEKQGYYRFSDFQAGDNRAYTEFFFKGDRMTMDTYTNKFNRVSPLELHSRWKAVLGDRESVMDAVDRFDYPQPRMVRDFSHAFEDMSESIFFTFERDPYPADEQPFLGKIRVNITIDGSLAVEPDHELFLLLCTESLFEGGSYKPENWKYFSRYVYLPPDVRTYTFENIHPGKYYLYSYNDIDGDKRHLKGDYMSSLWDHSLVVPPENTVTVDTHIDFVIP